MKKLFFIVSLIVAANHLRLTAAETGDEDNTDTSVETGYRIELTNQTSVPLEGYIYFVLGSNNKHALTLPAKKTAILWSGKVSEQLTAGEIALFNMTGQLIGAVATGVVGAKTEYELPGGAGDALGTGLVKLLNIFNTCVAGFEFVYNGKKYEYQFSNGCTNNTLMFRPINFGTELGVFAGSGQQQRWGNVTRVKA